MARKIDIIQAFNQSIKIARTGKRTVETVEFVEQLASYGQDWSLSEANTWIDFYKRTWRDISSEEGDSKTYFQFNPNGGD